MNQSEILCKLFLKTAQNRAKKPPCGGISEGALPLMGQQQAFSTSHGTKFVEKTWVRFSGGQVLG